MAKTNNRSLVEYKGKLEDLVIKVNGVIVYSGESKKPTKSAALQKDQEDLILVSKFASCINHVPELKGIWKQVRCSRQLTSKNKVEYTMKSKFGRPSAFNKIVSANRREISLSGRPNIKNVILPRSESFPYSYSANFNSAGLDIELQISNGNEIKVLNDSTIIPVGVFCFCEPKKIKQARFEMIPKYYEINNFQNADTYKIHFPIIPDDIKIMSNYKSCVFYFGIVEHAKSLKRVRWFRKDKGIEFAMEGFPKKCIRFGTETPKMD